VSTRSTALARLADAASVGAYVGLVQLDTTITLAVNTHLRRILGYADDAPDADVRPFAALAFVDGRARAELLGRLTKDGSVSDYLVRCLRIDGKPVWIELTARADADPGGKGLRIEAFLRDVSERKKLDDDTREIYHQMLQSEKMAALGQTISGVAHELNNPLATILTWAERLAQTPALDASVRRGLTTILGESERAARIVRNLLTFARKRNTTRAMVDVNQVVRETLALRAYEQRITNITVIDALAAGLPPAFADGHQLKQVLLNLVINAEQAMLGANGRGTLVVRSWHDTSQESIVVEVNDDGPGIPIDVRSKIFDPFFTTKEVGKGTGLGLTVAYAIVHEHGGRLRLESGPSGGASFFVELPITGGRLPPVPRQSPARADAVEAIVGAVILIVEDEAALASAMADALSDVGYVTERAADGEEALARITDRRFDLVICDLKMPRLDGRAFHRRLSTIEPEMAKRVVFVSGEVDLGGSEEFFRESGCRWLAKPFRLADLLNVVREGLG
jgi:two-component system cell cycle sensor histidine kinase/response regulator CckA